MIEEVDEVGAPSHVPAQRTDCLRQRPDLDVDPAVHTEMVDGSAPVGAEHAARMWGGVSNPKITGSPIFR